MMEIPLGQNLQLILGPGFTYFPDQFTYGYWDVRYAPISGKTLYVNDPVTAKNFLIDIKIGINYRF